MAEKSEPPRLSIKDAAAQLGISYFVVRRMLQRGVLRGHYYPSGAHAGVWRVAQADLDAFMRRTENVTESRIPERA